ncbi:hemagglutinin repeat-containing protein [Pseudomonas sp. NPDC086581]|uniref:two-partner secretion domain-containing protein n=1 Tax=Pseudomonas sp. NPDC086581 TaxID=3364432 RepID=UPI003824B5F1
MNHVFRVIWSLSRNAFVVASEHACSHGKRGAAGAGSAGTGSRIGVFVLGSLSAALYAQSALAGGAQSADGNTQVYRAGNGVQVIDIAAGNAAGVSHNRYIQYNVDPSGQVLNNNSAKTGAGALQSQLAGQVMPNLNLNDQARVILNEVVANNRSSLQGYTEVLGGEADVIVANPYGITCAGCGFINSDRATLTTGQPVLGADGSVSGFQVNRGDILITGKGLDGQRQDVLDLVARNVLIDGQVNGKDVSVVAGSNRFNYADRSVTAQAADGNKPAYAIDSTALGGMYANRIRLLATEDGVGVRMRGEAASASDFTLSASGRIELNGRVSAEQNLAVKYAGSQADGNAVQLNGGNAELSAKGDIALDAGGGGVSLTAGKLTADRDLGVSAGSLLDSSTGQSRFAGRNLRLSISGNAAVDGSAWGAGDASTLRLGSLQIGAKGANLYAGGSLDLHGRGDVNLGAASLNAGSRAQLVSETGSLSSAGQVKAQKGLSLDAAGQVENAGQMLSGGDLDLQGAGLSNSGTVQAAGALRLGTAARELNLDNRAGGQLLGDTLTVQAGTLSNLGTLQASQGSEISARSLSNQGKVLGSTVAGKDTRIRVNGALVNQGSVQSAGALRIDADGVLGNSGKLLALDGAHGGSNGVLEVSAQRVDNSGVLDAGGDLSATARASGTDSFVNSGKLQSAGNLRLDVGGALSNAAGAQIIADGALSVTSALGDFGLGNLGLLQGRAGLSVGELNRRVALLNDGQMLSGGRLVLVGSTLDNRGSIQAGTGTQVTANSLLNTGTGKLLASTVAGSQDNFSLGSFDNQGQLQSAGSLNITTSDVLQNSGTLWAQHASGSLLLKGKAVDNRGNVEGAGATTLISTGLLSNSGQVHSAGDLALDGTGGIDNTGKLLGERNLSLDTSETATLSNSGRIQAAGNLRIGDIGAQFAVLNNGLSGILLAGQALSLSGNELNNQGKVSAAGTITAQLNSLTNGAATNYNAAIVAGGSTGDSQFTLGDGLDNYGAIHANANLNLNARRINNHKTGGLSSLGELALRASSGAIDNDGALYAGQWLWLNASEGGIYNRVGGTVDSSGGVTSSSYDFVNNSSLVAQGDISISVVRSFINETTLADGQSISKALGGVENVRNRDSWKIANEGALDKGINAWVYEEDFTRREHLVGISEDALRALPKAGIIATGAGSQLSINYGSSGLNKIAVLSASNVSIGGTGTFTNEDMTLYSFDYTRRWIRVDDEKSSADDHFVTWARTDPSRDSWDGDPDDDDNDLWDWNPGWGWTRSEEMSGGSFPSELESWAQQASIAGAVRKGSASTVGSFGAGIFASSFHFTSGTLNNAGSPYASDTSKVAQSGLISGSVKTRGSTGEGSEEAKGIGSLEAIEAAARLGIVAGGPLSFASLDLRLPSNPNGYFVISRASDAGYLIETNPLFAVGSAYLGSDYLARLYGYDTDALQRRLGDADYEAYLIRQQLIRQVGSNVIHGYANEAEQMKQMMDQTYAQSGALGLEFGKALTAEQASALTQDIVWMEEVQVGGQKVLAPRVYLAANTIAAVATGAVIAANDVNIGGSGLNNTGGTIAGSNRLTVNTSGDINNTSGTLRGGDVSLTSSQGSIRNQTLAEQSGDSHTASTNIGNTASIESTGNLAMNAAKDIAVTGGNVTAQGNASLTAGENVTFETLVDHTASTTGYVAPEHSGGNAWGSQTTTRDQHIGSTLNSGGNLAITSGGDTTIAGSKVGAGGDLAVSTGGDFSVEARQDSQSTQTTSHESGLGVGGGIAGHETITTDDFKGTNAGSGITVGGNASVDSKGSMTLQGSSMKVAGDADIDATQGINVLDGMDEERHSKTTETTTFLKVGGSGSASSGSGTGAHAGVEGRKASAGAQASADAQASGSGDLKFSEHTTTTSNSGSRTSVGSTLRAGGDLRASTDGTLKVQGSTVESGKDMTLAAGNTEVLAGRNETWSNSSTSRQSTGVFSDGSAQAEAQASAEGQAGVPAGARTGAQAGASTSAEGTATIGVRSEHDSSSDYALRNSGSTLRSGGDLSLNSQGNATFVGAHVESGGDMNIAAKNIDNRAAQDIDEHSSDHSSQTAGVYFGGDASAQASAGAHGKVGTTGAGAKAEASVGGEANGSAGLRYQSEESSQTSGSVTQVTSSFKAGGNLTRTATDTITDQGTQLEAGGDINQSAREIRDLAVSDSQYSSSDGSHHEARAGVGASAGAEAAAGANHKGETQAGAGASAGIGLRASYEGGSESAEQRDTQAVTTRYKAGGNINSSSSGATQLIGTQMQAGRDVNLQAGSLDYQSARNTSSSESHSQSTNAELKVDVVGKAGGEMTAGHSQSQSGSSSSTAQVGGIAVGGNINIRTQGDTTLEGTQLAAGNGASIDAGGNVNFKAAHDTAESQSSSTSVEVGGSTERAGSSSASGGFTHDESSDQSDVARSGSIKAGNGGISIRSGGDSKFEGTRLSTAGDTDIAAGGNVRLGASTGTESGDGKRLELSGGMETNAAGAKKKGSLGAGESTTDRAASSGTVIQSGGSTRISGGTVVDQQATIESGQGTQISGTLVKAGADDHDNGDERQLNLKMNQDPKDSPAADASAHPQAATSLPVPGGATAGTAAMLKPPAQSVPGQIDSVRANAAMVQPLDLTGLLKDASPQLLEDFLKTKQQTDAENAAFIAQKQQEMAGVLGGDSSAELAVAEQRVTDLIDQAARTAKGNRDTAQLNTLIEQAQKRQTGTPDLTQSRPLEPSDAGAREQAQQKLEAALKAQAGAAADARSEQMKKLQAQKEAVLKATQQSTGKPAESAASASPAALASVAQTGLGAAAGLSALGGAARIDAQQQFQDAMNQADATVMQAEGEVSPQQGQMQAQARQLVAEFKASGDQQVAAQLLTLLASMANGDGSDSALQARAAAAKPAQSDPAISPPASSNAGSVGAAGNGTQASLQSVSDLSLEDMQKQVQDQRDRQLAAQLKSQVAAIQQANSEIAARNQTLGALSQAQQILQQLSGTTGTDGLKQAQERIGQLAAQHPNDQATQQALQQVQQMLTQSQAVNRPAAVVLREVGASVGKLVDQGKANVDQKSSQQQMDMSRLQELTNKRNASMSVMTESMKKAEASRSETVRQMR